MSNSITQKMKYKQSVIKFFEKYRLNMDKTKKLPILWAENKIFLITYYR